MQKQNKLQNKAILVPRTILSHHLRGKRDQLPAVFAKLDPFDSYVTIYLTIITHSSNKL